MKINFQDYDLAEFLVKEGNFCGVPSKLIIPNHIGTKFTQTNKIFRSSVWDLCGNLLSASYFKFVNFGENPDNFPVPLSLDNTTIVDKIDGSACIIDVINDRISMRTRGVFDINGMENANDFHFCLDKYPKIVTWLQANSNYSLITEITTPNLRIVIRYGDDPDFWLTGAINKDDYSLMPQAELNKLALELGLKRPSEYTFSSITDLLENVEKWVGKEGVCLYSSDGQSIWKVKSADYLVKHRLKDELGNFEKVVDFYAQEGFPQFSEFQARVAVLVDWETATEIVGDISRCVDAYKEVSKIIDGMQKFVNDTLLPMGNPQVKADRAKIAKHVISAYGITNRATFIFKLLDSKPLEKDDKKKLLYQCLSKK